MQVIELTLAGLDLEALRRFYVGVLGLRELEPGSTGRLAVQAGRTCLFFIPAPLGATPSPEISPRYHFAMDVPPARFANAVNWLHERGGPIASPTGQTQFHSDSWNADNIYFSDPQGNILELICRHEEPNARLLAASATPFNASEIMGITEIGLTADSVVNTTGALISHMPGLKIYSGEGSDEFTAVGSREGLFIVVRRGRIWFPETGVPADFLPLSVLVELETGHRYRVTAPPFPFSAASESV